MATRNNNTSMTVGQISGFNPQTDNWNTYMEQLEFFMKQAMFQMTLKRAKFY